MAVNIYVGNLPYNATEQDLRQAFEAYGEVSSSSVIEDKFTGKSRGFGFVEMPDKAQGDAAIAALNGQDMMGRKLRVNEARPKTERRDGGRFDDERPPRDG